MLILNILTFSNAVDGWWIKKSRSDVIDHPIVFVPGDGGSQLEAKLTNAPSPPGYKCDSNSDWFRIWLNIKKMVSSFACVEHLQNLQFDSSSNTSSNLPGVSTRISGFGTSAGIEYIDPSWTAYFLGNAGKYAHDLVEKLVERGYKRDVSIRGAPYDFRFAMSSNSQYFDKLRDLIENMYTANDNKKVIVMSHSMGGLYSRYFLNKQTQAWKDKYVSKYIPLSTPWGGSTDTLHALVSGYTFGIPLIDPLVARTTQRTCETNYLMLPTEDSLSKTGQPTVQTPTRNYTASPNDTVALLTTLGIDTSLYHYVIDQNNQSASPGVKSVCMFGTNVDTDETLVFKKGQFPDEQPEGVKVNGDGTVSRKSASLCRAWATKVVELPGVTHSGILSSNEGIDAVLKEVFED